MKKVQTINFKEFLDGSWKTPKKKKVDSKEIKNAFKDVIGVVSAAGLTYRVLSIETVFAATAEATFGNVYEAIMRGIDAGVVLIIIFAGVSWCLGHRSKAIEYLICCSCGYVLCRHAIDIRNFLRTI